MSYIEEIRERMQARRNTIRAYARVRPINQLSTEYTDRTNFGTYIPVEDYAYGDHTTVVKKIDIANCKPLITELIKKALRNNTITSKDILMIFAEMKDERKEDG